MTNGLANLKGNCRFGPKCANIHILPDGRRVDYTKSISGGASGSGHLSMGSQICIDHYHSPKSASTLTNSYLRLNAAPSSPYGQHKFPGSYRDEKYSVRRGSSVDMAIPSHDRDYPSASAKNYHDEDMRRYGLGSSRPGKILNVMDTHALPPLDQNGASWLAHRNSLASSVPFGFGPDSLPDSSRIPDDRSSDVLKNLHSSGVIDDPREKFTIHNASPPGYLSEDYPGIRTKHASRPKIKLASVNVPEIFDNDWGANFSFEEDYLPETLKDLMTPQEKARRGSRNADEDSKFYLNGNGAPSNDIPNKIGSPSNLSPSRWGSLFHRQQQKEEEDRARVSFHHVGSPLRKTSLHPVASPKAGPITRPSRHDDSSFFLSPRRNSTSIISQQLHRSQFSDIESSSNDFISLSSLTIGQKTNVNEERVSDSITFDNSDRNSVQRIIPNDKENYKSLFKMEGTKPIEKRQSTGGWHNFESMNRNSHLGVIGGTMNGMFGR